MWHKLGIFKISFIKSFQHFLILFLSLFICIDKLYLIKPSHFNETEIYARPGPKAQKTPLLSCKSWYHLLTMELSVLRNWGQTPNKIMKNEAEYENKNNTFNFTVLACIFFFKIKIKTKHESNPGVRKLCYSCKRVSVYNFVCHNLRKVVRLL